MRYGGGEQLRDFTYVADAVDAFLLAAADAAAVGKVFNLGGDPVISLKELAQLLVEIHGNGQFTLRAYPVDRQRIDIGHYYADYSLIRKTLGWEPRTPLRLALAQTLAYYRDNLAHYLDTSQQGVAA